MDPRYARNVPALSEAECELLRRKRVLVVGCGGLGGHLIDMLARIGIGSLRVVDGDAFEPSNLNRQLLSEVSLLGVGKAQTAAERVRRVNPNVAVHAVGEFLTEENAAALLTDCDAVLDGLDNIQSRQILANACERAGIPPDLRCRQRLGRPGRNLLPRRSFDRLTVPAPGLHSKIRASELHSRPCAPLCRFPCALSFSPTAPSEPEHCIFLTY
mgnify:CR=1 FL=1